MVELFEKLGLFYLGQDIDKESLTPTDALTLLKNKNFTTHAAIIGMTGSGKTGLGIGLIEEAAIDNIPSIIIDPKGDMGNLLLTDPDFSSASFEPWVADEARSKDKPVKRYAKDVAAIWKKGIESHHQTRSRVEKFTAVEKTIYTPGSSAGISVNVLSSLDAPPAEIMQDSDTFASYLISTVSSLLSLVGVEANPVESREYLLLAQLFNTAWMNDETLSLEDLIGKIINPPFKKIGVLPLETFYPQKDRFKFATKFNSIIASPTFKGWLEGNPIDIQQLLYDDEGKAKISIFSIAHLSDDERMFFVTLLLNKYIAWMRRQSGAASLKTLLYMDEITGFFPPSKNPPSKEPMLLLLKQARAFGVGVVLSTQNPVDLDYKGLSNIGTWFIGRLQTQQDIKRVIDGLGGKTGSRFSRKEITTLLTNLKNRHFFLKSAYLDDIRLFSTRWAMSYLKGPLKRDEISTLMAEQKSTVKQADENIPASATTRGNKHADFESYTSLDKSIPQLFQPSFNGNNQYSAKILAKLNLHYFNQTRGIDIDKSLCLSLPLEKTDHDLDWGTATNNAENTICTERLATRAPTGILYGPLPEIISTDKRLSQSKRSLKDWAYHAKQLDLFRTKSPKMESRPYETLGDFKVRVNDALSDEKEEDIDTLKERYAKKEKVLVDRLDRAMLKLDKEKEDKKSSFMNAGITVLGALFGRSRASIGRAGTRIMKERGDVGRAKDRINKIQDDIESLEIELEEKIDELADKFAIENVEFGEFAIKLRKTDIVVEKISVVWSTE